jgi:methionyl-tRNA formyltransferase
VGAAHPTENAMRIVMMGTGLFAEPTFEALLAGLYPVVGLVTQPDRAVGQERGSTRQTGRGMKAIALEHAVSVLQPESINTPDGAAALRELKPDLLVVAAFGQILSREILEAAPLGGVNVHASLLPKYRGAAPVAWAIYHGETRTGVTIIKMTTGLDAGDMLAQEAIDIGPDETAGELEARLATLGANLAVRVIDRIAAGTAQGVKQDKAQVTKAPKLKKEEGLIDWTRTAEQVCNQVRAMQPWPTAYTFLHRHGKSPLRVLITRAVAANCSGTTDSPPSQLIRVGNQGVYVAAGGSTQVKVFELQPAGKRPMSAPEFFRGHPIKAGDHFGPEKE